MAVPVAHSEPWAPAFAGVTAGAWGTRVPKAAAYAGAWPSSVAFGAISPHARGVGEGPTRASQE